MSYKKLFTIKIDSCFLTREEIEKLSVIPSGTVTKEPKSYGYSHTYKCFGDNLINVIMKIQKRIDPNNNIISPTRILESISSVTTRELYAKEDKYCTVI